MKTTQEQIEVMQHYADGGKIELYDRVDWADLKCEPRWNWDDFDYRKKIEPVELEIIKSITGDYQLRFKNQEAQDNFESGMNFVEKR